mmetsp:Transcript_33515/g.60545  ORF Transcript_33515/g.60545 Transcript_33515/m.60545 type:complete len:323 (+) Transcript_33515:704-1672(+)
MVHLDGEDLASAGVGGGVGGEEDNLITGLDDTLLDAASKDITDTLNLVGTGDGETEGAVALALGEDNEVVEDIEESGNLNLLVLEVKNLLTLPPGHVGGLGDEVVTQPTGDGDDGDGLLDEVILPADADEHVLHLIGDLLVALLLVAGGIRVHLVDTDNELLDTKKVDKTSVLASLALDLTGLVVTLLDGGGEVTIGGNHEEADIGLGGTGNHVLDEISMARGINDGVVPVVGEELLGGAGNGDTTLTLLLSAIHVESEGEGRLTEGRSLLLKLLKLTLGDTTELEEETASGSGLTTIDVTADNNGKMGLTFRHSYFLCKIM